MRSRKGMLTVKDAESAAGVTLAAESLRPFLLAECGICHR